MRKWRLCIALACAGTLGLLAAVQAAGQPLELEDLTAPPATFATTYSCNTAGTSTVSWTAQGVATGPYPGTFTASGSLTIGPQTLPGQHPPGPNNEGTVAGPIESFQETFTIQSGTTTITGTKTLDPQATSGTQGTCQQVSQFPILDFFDGQGTVVEVNAQTLYDAEINAVTGTETDHGIAFVSLSDTNITGSCPTGTCQGRLAGFNQTFALSLGPSCDEDGQGDEDPGCQGEDETP
jgi:hypothetical protein